LDKWKKPGICPDLNQLQVLGDFCTLGGNLQDQFLFPFLKYSHFDYYFVSLTRPKWHSRYGFRVENRIIETSNFNGDKQPSGVLTHPSGQFRIQVFIQLVDAVRGSL
jgi:hypothetical protein